MKKAKKKEKSSKERIDHLTGLRFFAAFLVFLSHVNYHNEYEVLQVVFKQGFIGVSFFFMLSGFVLSYSYKERLVSKQISKFKYLVLRYVRIYPLHIIVSIPIVLLALPQNQFFQMVLGSNLGLLQSWVPSSLFYFSYNAPSWSLSNEMFFYYCLIWLAFMKPKTIKSLSIILTVIITVTAIVANINFPDLYVMPKSKFVHWLFYIFPAFRIVEFLIGMWLYNEWKEGKFKKLNTSALSMIVLIIAMGFGGPVPEAFRYSLYFLPFVAFFLVSHLSSVKTKTFNFFGSKLLVLLGEASFAFYLIHQKLMNLIKFYFPSWISHQLLFTVVSLILISLASIIIHLYIEKPVEKFLKGLVNKAFAKPE